MKKFFYLVVVILSLSLSSCGDTNVFNPAVEVLDQNWILEHKISFFQALTTDPLGDPFTWIVDNSNSSERVLYIRDVITTDSKTEMRPYVTVLNNGKSIDITYRDESPVGSASVGTTKNTEMRHYFRIVQQGKGTGLSIPVSIHYVYPNTSLGTNRNESKTLTF